MLKSHFVAFLSGSLLVCVGCSTSPTAPQVPVSLQAPPGQSVYLEALATGVQIYECSRKDNSSFDWVFKAPEASLQSRSGELIGKHYAGPTWEAVDGSTVVGEVKAKDPGPKTSAIPWLLLSAKANSGTGTFAVAKSIQRVATEGGVAPGEPCTKSKLTQVARVPYTATYYFYR